MKPNLPCHFPWTFCDKELNGYLGADLRVCYLNQDFPYFCIDVHLKLKTCSRQHQYTDDIFNCAFHSQYRPGDFMINLFCPWLSNFRTAFKLTRAGVIWHVSNKNSDERV